MKIQTSINRKLNLKELTFILIKELGFYLLLLLSLIYISSLFTSLIDSSYAFIVSAIIVIAIIIVFYKRRNFRKTKITGNLIIEPDLISLLNSTQQTKITILDIKDLKINYNGYLGLHYGTFVSNGDLNRIRFNYQNINYDFQFDLDSKRMFDNLTSIFNEWYKRKIKFKEYNLGQRSFLFNVDNSFDEIQKLKEQFELDW